MPSRGSGSGSIGVPVPPGSGPIIIGSGPLPTPAGVPGTPGAHAGSVAMATDPSVHDAPTRPHHSYGEGSVLGSYRLIRQIGAGGMGRVFVAEHTRLGRRVALKILRPEYSGHQEAVKRFFAEARTVNRIHHENIIEISDFIEGEAGPSFYIMELLEGVDLRASQSRGVAFPLQRALAIALQVARGLGAAHEAGVIHRDLKPENIFLVQRTGQRDFVKLLDFGVAKLLNAKLDEVGSFKSIDGVVVGTPEYMAPEQALGEAVDHRADIYSFGVILFEMITGRPPFKAESAREHMAKHIMATPPRPTRLRAQARDVPALDDVILSCLEKVADDRPPTMRVLEERLQKILDSLPESEVETGRPAGQRRWALGLGLGAASIAVGVALAWVSVRGPSDEGVVVRALPAPSIASAVAAPNTASSASPGTALPPSGPAAADAGAIAGRVQITFESTPPGASVYRLGVDRPLGVTPFVGSFEASEDLVTFEFRMDGFRVEKAVLPIGTDGELKLPLSPLSPLEAHAAASGAPSASTGGRKHGRSSRTSEAAEPVEPTAGTAAPTAPVAVPAQPPAPPKPVNLDHDVVLNPFE